MSIIDEKGRLLGKINIIDLLVVAIILAGIAGLGYKLTKSKTVNPFSNPNKVVLEFYGDEVPDFAATNVKINDTAKDYEKGGFFGKVSGIVVDKSFSTAVNSDGEYVKSSRPGYASIKVTVEGEGIYNGSGIVIDNIEYFIGKSITLRAGDSVLQSRLYSIKKKE